MKIPKLTSPKAKKLFKVLFVIAIFTVLVSVAVVLTWYSYFKVQPKYISGINWYQFPITVKAAGQEQRLEMLDTYSFEALIDKDVLVSIYAEDGTLLNEHIHTFDTGTSYVTDLWSEDDTVALCFVEADVTPFFFQLENYTEPTLGEVKTIVSEPSTSGQVSYKFKQDYYMYLNNYSIDSLPDEIPASSKVLGFYPVSCESTTDSAALTAEIEQWTFYNAAEQRALYDAEVNQILETPEYN